MNSRYVRWLDETWCSRDDGPSETFCLPVLAGLPAPGGVVLTREAHRRFLESSGLLGDIESSARQRRATYRQALHLRRRYRDEPLEKDLDGCICGAILDLGARTVVVVSEEKSEGGLGTIPAVISAVRRAWLPADGLKRQIEVVSRNGEAPTWQILIRREVAS